VATTPETPIACPLSGVTMARGGEQLCWIASDQDLFFNSLDSTS
jgi:hypothetical protein